MASEYAYPTTEVEFTKQGALHDGAQIDSLLSMIDDEGTANLIVLSHGWNNDMSEARRLYRKLLDQVQHQIEAGHVDLEARTLGVLAVLWPSKKLAEGELIPSGAAGLGGALGDEAVIADIKELSDAFDVPDADVIVDRLTALVPVLEDSPQAQRDFADLARRLLVDSSDAEVRSELPDWLRDMPGDELLQELGKPDLSQMVAPGEPSDIGTAAGLGSFLSGIKGGALTLMNLLTYNQMKDRAGVVGMRGLRPVLEEVVNDDPQVKLHLVGHSFGARLVTAAILGDANAARLEVASLTLLQGAFSHNGLAANYDQKGHDGFFRLVMSDHRVSGPVIITHTINDRAVGLAYPIASRLAGQDAAGIGDAQSLFGGMGRIGAQHTPEVVAGVLGPPGTVYDFRPGKVHNLLADQTISSHADVANEAVGGALAAVIAATLRLKVYVSSTSTDLKEHRERVNQALRRSRYTVVAMEDYAAAGIRPLKKCLDDVAECDVYVGIFGWRYGYVPADNNLEGYSITEHEYRKAVELGKEVLVFLVDPDAPWPPGSMDAHTGDGDGGKRIERLRNELSEDWLVSYFTHPDDLANLVQSALHIAFMSKAERAVIALSDPNAAPTDFHCA